MVVTFVPAHADDRGFSKQQTAFDLRNILIGIGRANELRIRNAWVRGSSPLCAPSIKGCRLDLLLFKCSRRLGAEIKRMDAPSLKSSMRIAFANLQLAHLTVVYLGKTIFMSWRRR